MSIDESRIEGMIIANDPHSIRYHFDATDEERDLGDRCFKYMRDLRLSIVESIVDLIEDDSVVVEVGPLLSNQSDYDRTIKYPYGNMMLTSNIGTLMDDAIGNNTIVSTLKTLNTIANNKTEEETVSAWGRVVRVLTNRKQVLDSSYSTVYNENLGKSKLGVESILREKVKEKMANLPQSE